MSEDDQTVVAVIADLLPLKVDMVVINNNIIVGYFGISFKYCVI